MGAHLGPRPNGNKVFTGSSRFGDGLFDFTSFTFTNCGTEGRVGPALSAALSSYNTSTYGWLNDTSFFNITQVGIQEFTVPKSGTYRIDASGAQGGRQGSGGSTPGTGGTGARVIADVYLNKSDVLKVAVGQAGRGGNGWANIYPAGGGGTFAWINDPPSNPLVIAGGGGGLNSGGSSTNINGQSSNNAGLAYPANNSTTSMPGQVVAVGHGSYRQSSRYSCAGGGAGWLNEGNCSTRSNQGSSSPEKQNSVSSCGGYGLFGRDLRLLSTRNDGNRLYDYNNSPVSQTQKLWGGWGSGQANNSNSHTGGFGGGGGGGWSGEGGGGGYTGGGATWGGNNHGGGGGSYYASGFVSWTNGGAVTAPHGQLVLTFQG